MLTNQRSWKSGVLVLGLSLCVASRAAAQVAEIQVADSQVVSNGKAPPPSGRGKIESLYSDYRSWKPVNQAPKLVLDISLADCAAPRPDSVGPHKNGYINIYVSRQ